MEGRQTTGKIAGVLDICRRMRSERDLGSLLRLISDEAKELVASDRFSIFLLDREKNELWSMVTQEQEAIRFDARLGVAGAAASEGRTINVPDAYEDSRFFKEIDVKTGYRTRQILAVPLKNALGEVVGVCEALNKAQGTFSEEDEQILETFAEQAAVAIETVQLMNELEKNRDRLAAENQLLKKEFEGRFATQKIIGMSQEIQEIIRLIDQIRDSSVDVLIQGESGTGKEMVAKALHANSPRAFQPFIALNCAALPENLVESELFGIEKGVATGVNQRTGKFEEAQGGTLFLDEIGDLSLAAQAKILRVLQERMLDRVGGRRSIAVDVRVIAATNQDLAGAMREGRFREDLYFRLNVIQIRTPVLREIPEDIPILAQHYLSEHCVAMRQEVKELTPAALRCLEGYSWPGNVRQLAHEMQRLAVSVRRRTITPDDLDPDMRGGAKRSTNPSVRQSLHTAVEELERQMIGEALEECHWNQQHTATLLGLSRQGLIKKMKRYGFLT